MSFGLEQVKVGEAIVPSGLSVHESMNHMNLVQSHFLVSCSFLVTVLFSPS